MIHRPITKEKKSKFYTSYESLLNSVNFENMLLISVLDPSLGLSYMVDTMSLESLRSFTLNFTIDFYLPILVSNKRNLVPKYFKLMNSEFCYNQLEIIEEHQDMSESSAHLFNYLLDQIQEIESIRGEKSESFKLIKLKIVSLLDFKLNFLINELKSAMENINANDKLGEKVNFIYLKSTIIINYY